MSPPRRGRARKRPEIDEIQWAFLNDALDGNDLRREDPEHKWRLYELFANASLGDNRPIVDELWQAFGPVVVQRWAFERPGTRPSLWWKYDAPRARPGTFKVSGAFGTFPEPRRRLGGTGTPCHEYLAYVPVLRCGLPALWISADLAAHYGPRFKGEPIDPDDPPLYEAQATYLERHGLLLAGERKRLKARDFQPEAVLPRMVDA